MYSVVFEDENFLIVSKPSGVLVHKTHFGESDNLVDFVLRDRKEEYFLVNRIDKFTSGIVILSKNKQTLKMTQQLFSNQEIEKQYLAIVSRELPAKNVKVNLSIGRSQGNKLMFSNRNAKNYKPATTEVSEISGKFVLVKPLTGRTHQIRCHLRDIGCPILNDVVYGGKETEYGDFGQFLHAYKVSFICPMTGKLIEARSPIPSEFISMLKGMDIDCSQYE